ncbi:aspartate-semialdehyde dehydrogenase [Longicatena caecimuris]|uniref:aspartate-semialdehyde dehydrogenase n=1 Tax=Longicatena caecimuris TaxID=1796635 RepID=UPI0022DEEE28|nr:aspartate-semialdehyde dehydrogenase [Longicatena caecimuris]
MRTYNVAILGATGAVGQEMIKILMERNFPINELHLLASKRSAGKKMEINGKEYSIEETTEQSFQGIDIVLGAAENDIAKRFLPKAVEAGAVVVDNSSAYRLDPNVPLVIPEVNPEAVASHNGIIANPNCATIIALVALAQLHRYAKAKRMVVSTYQAVSGAGVNGIRELNQQVGAIAHEKEVEVSTFQYQIAYNLIPQIGGFNEAGYSSEEMKMQNEGRKIMDNPDLCVNCTCVRVPVYRSHSESIMVEFDKEISVEKARALLQTAPGVKLVDDPEHQKYPMPLDTTDQDLVFVGRIREDMSNHTNALSFWCCGDQVRKGAATNAVQIAELVIAQMEK